MRDILVPLRDALDQSRPFCWCRVVETRGSTPQKAGAAMMVYPDGSQTGTLGGGCVEAEVKRRAIAVLDGQEAEIRQFLLDHDYGWDDGLICGGRMTTSLHAASNGAVRVYLKRLAELGLAGEGFTEAIVYDGADDGPARGVTKAATFLFESSGAVAAAMPAADAADSVGNMLRARLRPLATRPQPYEADGVAFLPSLRRCRLVIVGGGHVGRAVGDLAADLDFDVWAVDDRAEYVSEERFPRAERRIAGNLERVLPELDVTPDTYCLIVTRGHNHDERALFHLARRDAAFIGMIGSKRKIRMIFADLLAEGIPQEVLDRVHTPVGLDIGSRTVPEIAISIAAELIAHRNKPSGPPAV